MPTKITTDLKIKYLQQLELECGIKNGQLFEGVDVAEIRAAILHDIWQQGILDEAKIMKERLMALKDIGIGREKYPQLTGSFLMEQNTSLSTEEVIMLERREEKEKIKKHILENIFQDENAFEPEVVMDKIRKL